MGQGGQSPFRISPELQHAQTCGADGPAEFLCSVAGYHVFRHFSGAGQHRHNGEIWGNEFGRRDGRFADSQHRFSGDLSGGLKTRVAKAGDDKCVGVLLPVSSDDLFQDPRDGQILVRKGLDAVRAGLWAHRPHLCVGAGHTAGQTGHAVRHGLSGVGVDDLDFQSAPSF